LIYFDFAFFSLKLLPLCAFHDVPLVLSMLLLLLLLLLLPLKWEINFSWNIKHSRTLAHNRSPFSLLEASFSSVCSLLTCK